VFGVGGDDFDKDVIEAGEENSFTDVGFQQSHFSPSVRLKVRPIKSMEAGDCFNKICMAELEIMALPTGAQEIFHVLENGGDARGNIYGSRLVRLCKKRAESSYCMRFPGFVDDHDAAFEVGADFGPDEVGDDIHGNWRRASSRSRTEKR